MYHHSKSLSRASEQISLLEWHTHHAPRTLPTRIGRSRLSRSAAEQSLTAWRSLGDAGRAGAAASLLSLGHLLLQLHGVGAGIEEARCAFLAVLVVCLFGGDDAHHHHHQPTHE